MNGMERQNSDHMVNNLWYSRLRSYIATDLILIKSNQLARFVTNQVV